MYYTYIFSWLNTSIVYILIKDILSTCLSLFIFSAIFPHWQLQYSEQNYVSRGRHGRQIETTFCSWEKVTYKSACLDLRVWLWSREKKGIKMWCEIGRRCGRKSSVWFTCNFHGSSERSSWTFRMYLDFLHFGEMADTLTKVLRFMVVLRPCKILWMFSWTFTNYYLYAKRFIL